MVARPGGCLRSFPTRYIAFDVKKAVEREAQPLFVYSHYPIKISNLRISTNSACVKMIGFVSYITRGVGQHISVGIEVIPFAAVLDPGRFGHRTVGIKPYPTDRILLPTVGYCIAVSTNVAPTL